MDAKQKAEIYKSNLTADEHAVLLRFVSNPLYGRIKSVLESRKPQGVVINDSERGTLASYARRQGFEMAISTLEELTISETLTEILQENTEIDPLLDTRD
jgi:hypothetical protein